MKLKRICYGKNIFKQFNLCFLGIKQWLKHQLFNAIHNTNNKKETKALEYSLKNTKDLQSEYYLFVDIVILKFLKVFKINFLSQVGFNKFRFKNLVRA